MNPGSENNPCRACRYLFAFLSGFFALSVIVCFGQIDTVGPEMKGGIEPTGKEPGKHEFPQRYISLFGDDDILEVTLRYDITKYLKKADRDQSIDGIMTFHLSQTDSLQKKVTLRYRGKSRFERCRYPPTRVIFKEPLLEATDSGKIKRIKLVNQCQPGSMHGDYVIREYLVYKLYNVLTDTSYRVRLLDMKVIDSENKRRAITQYGMLLEPEGLVEKRLNLNEIKTPAVSQRQMNRNLFDRIAIFNYMVSNWDWSVPGQHNITVFNSLTPEFAGQGIPIPYDFDLAGVVNADYAIPPPGLGIETNRDRMFLGICRTREEFQNHLKAFLEKKDEFYTTVNDLPYLSKAAKRDITTFLDQFFDQLEKPRSFERMVEFLLSNCKN